MKSTNGVFALEVNRHKVLCFYCYFKIIIKDLNKTPIFLLGKKDKTLFVSCLLFDS